MGHGLLDVPRSHLGTPHSVGLLRTSDRPASETSTTQHTRHMPPGGIRTRNPSKLAGADPHLKTLRPSESAELLITSMKIVIVVWSVTTSQIQTRTVARYFDVDNSSRLYYIHMNWIECDWQRAFLREHVCRATDSNANPGTVSFDRAGQLQPTGRSHNS